MVDYLMFKEEIDVKTLKDVIANKIIYFSEINPSDKTDNIIINVERNEKIE